MGHLDPVGAYKLQATVQSRSRLRDALFRVALVFALFLSIRLVQVYRTEDSWPEKPKPRLSMKEREQLFLSVPDAESARAASRAFTAHPHVAGTPQDFQDALQMLEVFQEEFGISVPEEPPVFPAGSKASRRATLDLSSALHGSKPTAWVDVYYPVMDTGAEQRLEILDNSGNPEWTADLTEVGDPLDPETNEYSDAVPTWHGASGDGDVQGQLVYANYGTREDYAELIAAGANLTGKVVIVRYGGVLRGLKIKGAEELGAVGLIMYSDPRDDGYVTVENGYEPYPVGPARNPTAVERGSVAYINLYPGDPTTPGTPAYEDSNRTAGSNGPRIPSLPISWTNAERLLEEIGGPNRIISGTTSAKSVRLVNHVDAKVTPIWNTMAAIPGHVRDEVVIVGCHRDAWVFGASDPIGGTAALHEVIRGYGALLKAGWKPLRTMLFASWDAEEYGLIGSTEYGEDFAQWLSAHAVAYVNLDNSGGSMWGALGSPSLATLLRSTAQETPYAGKTLWDARNDKGPFPEGNADAEFIAAYQAAETKRLASRNIIGPLGSGSDFTVFLEHLGIASVTQAFVGTPQDAVYHYHSIYDTQRWQETYADPGFHRAVAVAQNVGLLLLRLTDSIIVPLNTTQYALELSDYLDEIEQSVTDRPLRLAKDFVIIRQAILELSFASFALDAEKDAAGKEFERLLERMPKWPPVSRLTTLVKRVFGLSPECTGRRIEDPEAWVGYLNAALDGVEDGDWPHLPPLYEFIKAAKRVTKVNRKLIEFERGFLSAEGIKGREWYKHMVVAPGRWLGYGATTLPAFNEALLLDNDAEEARKAAIQLNLMFTALTTNLRA
ncbi:Zn-dependent exopeptidase [Roridomyces roridus]|uniref:Zn-dependent exopeptidase n=1 Tax=Roridomyces roridus TaxID=1738132 RepID=A0AAD7C5A4_9AGAR|nr:Zn-dependent exopeptidase [Roridomyces roridus]